jgi:protoheme IX farnesyltransferase
MNMVFDRDIDAAMERTRTRPIPSGVLEHRAASALATGMLVLGLILAHLVNRLFAVLALLGFMFDIPIYTNLFKRRTWLNILFGSGAGAMPAIGGWVAARGALEPGAIIMGLLVVAWIPMHIWFIAMYYRDDYASAGIPMAPIVLGPATTATMVQASLTLFIGLTWCFTLLYGYGFLAAAASTALALTAIAQAERFKREPSRLRARRLFKLANPVLGVAFTLLAVEGVMYWS